MKSITQSNASVTSGFVPVFKTRSSIACWWSIKNLIDLHPGNCWLWTLTFAEVLSYNYAGNCHRLLTTAIKNERRIAGNWPETWGAVKVAERHPGGHGLHFHWVAYPRLPIHKLLELAHSCGFGAINVHPEPCTPRVATYLAKYLIKGSPLTSVKQWGCLGDFEGVRVRDVEMSSGSIDAFRQAYREAIAAGKPRGVAFNYAKLRQREYDHDFEIPEQP